MTARSTFFQQLLHTRWRIFEVFLMLLTCFCVSNRQTVGQSIHSNPCSAGGHTWRISCFLRGHAPSDKLRIHVRQPHLHRVPSVQILVERQSDAAAMESGAVQSGSCGDTELGWIWRLRGCVRSSRSTRQPMPEAQGLRGIEAGPGFPHCELHPICSPAPALP